MSEIHPDHLPLIDIPRDAAKKVEDFDLPSVFRSQQHVSMSDLGVVLNKLSRGVLGFSSDPPRNRARRDLHGLEVLQSFYLASVGSGENVD